MKTPHEHWEVPLVASTSMDWFLSKERGMKAVQSRRLRVRNILGLAASTHLRRHSLGRHGTFQLDAPSVLICLLTDVRWQGTYTRTFGASFTAAGLPRLVRSEPFVKLTNETVHAVRERIADAAAEKSLAVVVNRTICRLRNEKLFLQVARDYSGVMQEVVDALPNVKRYTGHVVWIDGRDALVELDVGGEEEEETRTVDSNYLRAMGIDTDGQPIIAIDQHWSPDTEKSTYYQPAVVAGEDDPFELERWERLLRSHETPPPRHRGESPGEALVDGKD
jgi:hypothetical protein